MIFKKSLVIKDFLMVLKMVRSSFPQNSPEIKGILGESRVRQNI
jgi:hypothetical protein